ncbi:hypothetical protein ColKHC_05604 [Colletotrichum higginsianum]|nr:hypothetical protein ColKHC_05604 [Colletotrichum higginsianum]
MALLIEVIPIIALISDASYNTLAQLRLITPRLPRTTRRLLLPAAPPAPRRLSDALRAFSTHLDDRRARGFAVVVFAILANHVRRMVLPALGVGGFGAPIATLKLAAGSPAIFLEDEVRAGVLGRNAGWEGAWKVVGDAVGGYVVERVADGGGTKTRGQRTDRDMVVSTAVFLVWALGCAEYVHARAAHAAAVGIAHVKLLLGGPSHRRALAGILFPPSAAGVLAVLGSHLELACYVAYGLLPLLSFAAGLVFRRDPRRSRPGLAVLMAGWAWGTGYVARYSNKYYIGLEMSGLLLVGWWTLAATALFGWRALRARIRAALGEDGPS